MPRQDDEKIDLSTLKPGDPIAIRSYGSYGRNTGYTLTKVLRLTKTQVVVEDGYGPKDAFHNRRFRLESGVEVGKTIWPDLVSPDCQGVRDQQARNQARNELRHVQKVAEGLDGSTVSETGIALEVLAHALQKAQAAVAKLKEQSS